MLGKLWHNAATARDFRSCVELAVKLQLCSARWISLEYIPLRKANGESEQVCAYSSAGRGLEQEAGFKVRDANLELQL